MKARITVLVENTAQGSGLLGEHGLAYWIEYDGQHLLFDTGQGSALVGNAYKLSVPLRDLDTLVLSHGHYDHTGGVADVLKTNRPVTVYAHPAAFAPKYARNGNGSVREIGMPYPAEKAIRQPQNRLVPTEQPTTIFEGLMATGPVPRQTDFEDAGGPFFLDRDCRTPDPLVDDQSLFLETTQGTLVLLGCAHSGVINTLRQVRQLTRNRPIWTVIGGMHLVQASPQRIQRTVEELRQLGVQRLAPAHCTGMAAAAAIWHNFPEKCLPCHVGTQLEFELLQ